MAVRLGYLRKARASNHLFNCFDSVLRWNYTYESPPQV
jgi:hypothetical protein